MTTTVQDIIARLRQPVSSLEELQDLLAAPLSSLAVPVKKSCARLSAPPSNRQLATLQATILAHVCPAWEDQVPLIECYFCPTTESPEAVNKAIVLSALSVLTAPPLLPCVVRMLEKFVKTSSLEKIWNILHAENQDSITETRWNDVLRAWISIPGKVANALVGVDIPTVLGSEELLVRTCLDAECIFWSASNQSTGRPPTDNAINNLVHLVTKLIQTGHFSLSSPSFFPLVLPRVLSRIHSSEINDATRSYKNMWSRVVRDLPGPLLQTFTLSLFTHLDAMAGSFPLAYSQERTDETIPRKSTAMSSCDIISVLDLFLGSTMEVPAEVWNVILSGRVWNQNIVYAVIGWAARIGLSESEQGQTINDKNEDELAPLYGTNRERGLAILLERVLARWTDPQHVSRALLSEHRYLTSLLVLTLGALSSPSSPSMPDTLDPSFFDLPPSRSASPVPSQPMSHPLITSTGTSPAFIRSIGTYISHRDEGIRRCGMLVAELISRGKLDFGGWSGNMADKSGQTNPRDETMSDWQAWAADLRARAFDPLARIQREMENSVQGSALPSAATQPLDHITGPQETLLNQEKIDFPRAPSPEPDSDDESLVGYASRSESSSRAPSPTPSELADPMLRRRPIPRPVYLAELGALLIEGPKNVVEVQPGEGMSTFGGTKPRRGMGITGGRGGGDAEDEKGRIDMALEVGAELIRRKRGYGSELEENAVNLAFLFMGLQDNFELDRFEERRQTVLVALVACCPTKVAPTIIQQFFHHQYSTAQRFTMLNALAIGARELAGLPLPANPNEVSKRPRIDFPSKILPGGAHIEYLTKGDLPPPPVNRAQIEGSSRQRIEYMQSQVSTLVKDLSEVAITRSKQVTEDSIPQIVRERALRVGSKLGQGITPIDSSDVDPQTFMTLGHLSSQTPVVQFVQVAAEYFVAPLINRFWAYLQSSLELEAYRNSTGVRTGAGTGLILSPLVLTHLLGTLTILLHAARHSPAFLHVLAPDAAELALAIGTRPLSRNRQDDPDDEMNCEGGRAEAGVLAGALELALTVLDSALELDGGQVFALERAELLLGIGQWASTVFEALDNGERVQGGGGKNEGKAARIAAGLVLTSERIVNRWRRSIAMV